MNKALVLTIVILFGVLSCQRQDPSPKQEAELRQATTQRGAEMLAGAKQMLIAAKQMLMQEGKYGCCIKEACDYCALHEGSCDCYEDLKAGKHVCIECYSGWQRGDGAVENITKDQLKTDFVRHEH